MNINELIERVGGRERLEEIKYRTEMYGHGAGYTADEVELMARALLAVLDAQEIPVAFYANDAYYNTESAALKDGAEEVMPLYTTPPAASSPDGLAAAVNRLLASDGSRGKFSAVRRGDALAEVERLLAAAPAPGGNGE